jgi:sorting nexin-13
MINSAYYISILFSDEMKHLIGSETTRQGVLRVFELFQNPCLNRRLAYVVLENLVHELFPQHSVPEFFTKMHSVSNR